MRYACCTCFGLHLIFGAPLVACGSDGVCAVPCRKKLKPFWCCQQKTGLQDSASLDAVVDVQLLLTVASLCPDEASSQLLWASSQGHVEFVRRQLECGVPANARERSGQTALIRAAQRGNAKVVRLLLASGAAKDLRDKFGHTALSYAVCENHVAVVHSLLGAGVVKDLKLKHGSTALIYAARGGHAESACLLLRAGAGKDLQDDSGATALIHAAGKGHVEVVCLLLGEGAEKDLQDQNGASVVEQLAFNMFWCTLRLMIQILQYGTSKVRQLSCTLPARGPWRLCACY